MYASIAMGSRMSLAAALLLCAFPAWAEVNRQAIEDVAAGKIKVAKASWWGFDAEESTQALQAAIDSGAPTVIVNKMNTPWIVDRIRLAGNQELFFEEGVEVVAKKGAFKGGNDSLFAAGGLENVTLRGYGAVLRMHRDDYAGPEYERAEWRHVLNISRCTNVRVYGLTLAESGGDGIYLGGGSGDNTNKNVHIKDVVCDKNYRQGISVITAQDLLIEDCTLSNTAGTPPQCGIDFEPNRADQRLVNCVMRNCLSQGNAGAGYTVSIGALDEPVSMRFENCRSLGDVHAGARLVLPNDPERFKGAIDFVNCRFERNPGSGIIVEGNAAGGCRVSFAGCSILDPFSENPNATPIVFMAPRRAKAPVGSIALGDILIRAPQDRRPMSFVDMAGGVGLKDVSGTLRLEQDGKVTDIPITDELIAEWMPSAVMKKITRLTLDGLSLRPAADGTAARPDALRSVLLRGGHKLLLHATEGERVTFQADYRRLGRYSGRTMPITVISPSGTQINCPGAEFQKVTEIGFEAPETGVYRLSVAPGANVLCLPSSTHALLLNGDDGPIHLCGTTGTFFFWVPAGTESFGVRVSGEGLGEAVRAALVDPSGRTVEEVDNVAATHQFEVDVPRPSVGEAWRLVLSKPTRLAMEDQFIDLRGIPPLLAGSREGLLRPE